MIIALGGLPHSGATTVADILERQHGFARTSLSRPVEQALLLLNPVIELTLSDRELIGRGVPVHFGRTHHRYAELHRDLGFPVTTRIADVRRFAAMLGGPRGRNILGGGTWLDMVVREVGVLQGDGRTATSVVVTGIRSREELEAFSGLGALTLWVERPGISVDVDPGNIDLSQPRASAADFARVLVNNGSLADLGDRVA